VYIVNIAGLLEKKSGEKIMDTLTAIHTRRSVRSFTDEPVSEADLKTVLGAAMVAPSAGNCQCWVFLVIDDPKLLARAPEINQYAAMAAKAPLAVLVCGDTLVERYPGYWVQDCSAATENLLLAARAVGLGSVWTGIHPVQERVDKAKALFRLPENIMPLGLVVLGHPAKEQKYEDRYVEAKIRRNFWS
jgi:nitroreductase